MKISRKKKLHYCGYCGQEIFASIMGFQKHQNYCELKKVHDFKKEKDARDKSE